MGLIKLAVAIVLLLAWIMFVIHTPTNTPAREHGDDD
jgi:hypothetical protein